MKCKEKSQGKTQCEATPTIAVFYLLNGRLIALWAHASIHKGQITVKLQQLQTTRKKKQ